MPGFVQTNPTASKQFAQTTLPTSPQFGPLSEMLFDPAFFDPVLFETGPMGATGIVQFAQVNL